MSIFDFLDYRDFLKFYIESQPRKGWGVVSKVAEAIDMTQAHLSQVLAGTKNFSPEQAFKLSKFLNFSAIESDFIMLLVQYQRAGTTDLKDYYKTKIEKEKLEALRVQNHMSGFAPLTESEMNQFYSSWIFSAVRMFCSVEKGKTFQEILTHFHIPPKELTHLLAFLIDKGLLRKHDIYYQMGAQRTLAAKGSPQFLMHAKNWRLQGIQRCEKAKDEDIFLTSPMSLSKSDYEKLRNELLESIKKISKMVADSPAEQVVCLNIDLFQI